MRSVTEIKEDIVGIDDCKDERALAPKELSDADVCFISSALEDDIDDEDKRKLFAACVGKSEEEMATLAYAASTEPAEA